MPSSSSVRSARQGPRPLVRRMVYSELCASRAITKMVPISTVIGSSSYRWLGTSSAT
jgi:hypothetical protein